MRIIDEPLLQTFRERGLCEWCGVQRLTGLDPHHVFAKGMGGGGRLDVRINIVALCRTCHGRVHAGQIMRCDLLAIVAAREKTTQDAIEREIYALRRRKKDGEPAAVVEQ